MDDYISVDQCIDGGLYIIDARNFDVGLYNSYSQTFIGIRTKFKDVFLDEEIHWDVNEHNGTVKPLEFINVTPDHIDHHNYKNNKTTYNELFQWLKTKRNERNKNDMPLL